VGAGAARAWTEFTFMKKWSEHDGVGINAGCCGLCGNTGIIDTRGHAKTPSGDPAGIRAFCICPNGRKAKRRDGRRTWDFSKIGKSIIDAPEAVDADT
jgi:hypothetical protein